MVAVTNQLILTKYWHFNEVWEEKRIEKSFQDA